MNKYITSLLLGAAFLVSGCKEDNSKHKIVFSTSAEYPPFEFQVKGELKGFDIDLAKMIGEELGEEVVFDDRQFSTILPALQEGMADAAIATITIIPERQANFDFSHPYYTESLAIVFPKESAIKSKEQLKGKKIACQLGTTMEYWLKKHVPEAILSPIDNNNQAIETLKAGHVDGVMVDTFQAKAFSQKNPELAYEVIAQADTGYGIAFKKGSPLKDKVNKALKSLESKGAIKALNDKWLENDQWNQ